MKAIVVTDKAAGTAGMKLMERPEPQAAELASLSGANYGDVIVQVHASGFIGERPMSKSVCQDTFRCERNVGTVPLQVKSGHYPTLPDWFGG
jgi:hypothetical protein